MGLSSRRLLKRSTHDGVAAAERTLRQQIEESGVPEAREFVGPFAEPFRVNLDEVHQVLREERAREDGERPDDAGV